MATAPTLTLINGDGLKPDEVAWEAMAAAAKAAIATPGLSPDAVTEIRRLWFRSLHLAGVPSRQVPRRRGR